jgi:hypothetical protein
MAMPALSPPAWREAWLSVLSPARFATFEAAAGGDEQRGLALYQWNSAMGAAWLVDLSLIEIGLRNAIHDTLTAAHGTSAWWTSIQIDNTTNANIGRARRKLGQAGQPVTSGQIIAELTFGDWVRLLGRGDRVGGVAVDYTKTLWRPHLGPRFAPQTRKSFHGDVETLRKLRNRIAHHEPLITINHAATHGVLLSVAHAINPVIATHIAATSSVPVAMSQRP